MITYYQISITVSPIGSFELYRRSMTVFEKESAINLAKQFDSCVDVDQVVVTDEMTGEVILDYSSDGRRYIAGE